MGGQHNTCWLPCHPLALCHLWHWQQHTTMATQQWWRQVDNDDMMWQRQQWRQADNNDAMWQQWQMTPMITDDHNDDGQPRMMWRIWQWTMARTHECCPPAPHSHSCSTSILNYIHVFPMSVATRLVLNQSSTSWDWSFNCKKLTKTTLNWLMSVQSGFSWFFNLWGPVPVLVFSNFDKRLDWTRLPSTS